MPTTFDRGDDTSGLVTFTRSGDPHQSASSASDQEYDFLDFLGIAQSLKIDFLPIKWQPALDKIGEGGTAKIRQALINIQMTFAFKHLEHPLSAQQESRNLRALVAEISILGHPTIRHHPNIMSIEGICWDVIAGGKEVWPVLVFEKTPLWDLNRFMALGPGKELDSKRRLDILFDVALAVRDLHAIGVIHGDIKPENVLIFQETEGRHVARVIDFGYSSLFATESDRIHMPYSGIWTAPALDYRGILPGQARKRDAYSFGMLCLWLLSYNKSVNRDGQFKQDIADSILNLLDYASELLGAIPDLESLEKLNMQEIIELTLARPLAEGTASFNQLLQLLSPHRAFFLAPEEDKMIIPSKEFDIILSLHQLVEAHYGVRYYITKCLEKRRDRQFTGQIHPLNLAFCYELGFGVPQDLTVCRSLLSDYKLSITDFKDGLKQLKRKPQLPQFQKGIFRTLYIAGHISVFNYSQHYHEEQLSREAESWYQREVETMGSVLGEEHFLVQRVRTQLCFLKESMGNYKDAEKLQDQLIEIDKRFNGGRSQWQFATNLIRIYRSQGRWDEAERLQIQNMEMEKRAFSSTDIATLISMRNLASIYWGQGRWKEAEEMDCQVIETSNMVLGPEHPNTLVCIGNMATTYRTQGRLREAEVLFLKVIETSKKVLGAEHPITLGYMHNLASAYGELRRSREAEELEMQVITASKRVFGSEYPITLMSSLNLVSIYADQERWGEAEKMGIQVIETSKRLLGPEHPETLKSLSNQAVIYRNQEGRWKEAEELNIHVMETSKRVLGAEHPQTLRSMSNLATIYWYQKDRWKAAEDLDLQVVEASKRVLGPEHPDTLGAISDLASTYFDQGRAAETDEPKRQELLRKAGELGAHVMKTRKTVLGAEHRDTKRSVSDLATMYEAQGRRQEAEELRASVGNAVSI